jgi:hypothetical protein
VTVNLFSFVGVYQRILDTMAHILAKGAAHATAIGASEAEMLDWRLIDDMQPLRFQVMVVCNFARQWPARAAGLPVAADTADDLSLADFQSEIAAAKAFLAGLAAAQFENRDDVTLTVVLASGQMEPTLPAAQWLTGFATTNLFFHLSIAYAILRARGVAIGKVDLFPTGL